MSLEENVGGVPAYDHDHPLVEFPNYSLEPVKAKLLTREELVDRLEKASDNIELIKRIHKEELRAHKTHLKMTHQVIDELYGVNTALKVEQDVLLRKQQALLDEKVRAATKTPQEKQQAALIQRQQENQASTRESVSVVTPPYLAIALAAASIIGIIAIIVV